MILQAGMMMGIVVLFAILIIVAGSFPLAFTLRSKVFRTKQIHQKTTTKTKVIHLLQFVCLYTLVLAISLVLLYITFCGIEIM